MESLLRKKEPEPTQMMKQAQESRGPQQDTRPGSPELSQVTLACLPGLEPVSKACWESVCPRVQVPELDTGTPPLSDANPEAAQVGRGRPVSWVL